MPYAPRYLTSYDRIPLSGPEEFDQEAKERAVQHAESFLEADVNEGLPILEPEDIHRFAVEALATHVLTGGAASPQSTKLGDIGDAGGGRMDYARTYLDLYDRAARSIVHAGDDESLNKHTVITVR